jgi:hypothetical protein
MYVNN